VPESGACPVKIEEPCLDRQPDDHVEHRLLGKGQVRLEVVIPDGGTPGDPSDDGEPISVMRIKGSTGRSDPIGCPQFVSYLS